MVKAVVDSEVGKSSARVWPFRQTNSFIENSIEAGILLGGNGILHAMLVANGYSFAAYLHQSLVFTSLLVLALALALTPLALNALAYWAGSPLSRAEKFD